MKGMIISRNLVHGRYICKFCVCSDDLKHAFVDEDEGKRPPLMQ